MYGHGLFYYVLLIRWHITIMSRPIHFYSVFFCCHYSLFSFLFLFYKFLPYSALKQCPGLLYSIDISQITVKHWLIHFCSILFCLGMLFWNIRFYSILSCSGMFFYTFFVLILLYIHDLVYSIVIYSVDSILYYRYVGIFLSVQIYSVLFIYNSTHPYTISRRVCWPSLFISILFYTFTFSYVFLVYSVLVLFCSTIMSWMIHFYSVLLYSVDSVLTVVYWPLHFCSLLFSYIILSFLRFHVQLRCSILFMHYSSIMFVKSILFILILLCSGVLLFYPLHWSDLYYLLYLHYCGWITFVKQ